MNYIWQHSEWPEFRYNLADMDDILFVFAEETGHISGILKGTTNALQVETLINTLVAEAIKTSEIEGEFLSREDVVSSIRNNLGMAGKPEPVKDRKAQGAAELIVTARNSYAAPLTEAMLFDWHQTLLKDSKTIDTGAWRKGMAPMQVVSGSIGKEKVHFEAPPSERVPAEMAQFIEWFNATAPGGSREMTKAPVRSAIAHLYFETIHPFEDGNGRIGRVIAEKALSQTLGRPVMLSLSRTIEAERKKYYHSLETAQKNIYITAWIAYFVQTIIDAQIQTRIMLDFTLKKTRFFDQFKSLLNERETKVIQKMLETGPDGFEGGMTAKKYMSIAKTSKATATRDLQHLAEIQCLAPSGGGRSTSYQLRIPEN
ncbi:Fic family protein [Dyadobacter fermentans]|uniref:Filamentation induced by cAMP protein Fic n=1 Tax=Dyadobacter fermentans (strain ATCC 700827 / DSM 18053 / CIP 107007 / KCTC 52180 / NS114) TaxID=471854 RepID=C6VU96_DYAFD|nr:Fic family protein [Dyadobacter fermentans]ACT96578.1 filamentation induced by cAMP protein Fic [Dyadobacter fermentans DSM 18053]